MEPTALQQAVNYAAANNIEYAFITGYLVSALDRGDHPDFTASLLTETVKLVLERRAERSAA